MILKASEGYCPCCEQNTWFIAEQSWFCDYYLCQHSKSISRFRAIINRIREFVPHISQKSVFESAYGGASSVFTVPYYRGTLTSRRAMLNKIGVVEHIKDAVFHGNPISKSGSLVTFDWGEDIVDFIYKWTGMTTTIYIKKNEHYGIAGDSLEVFIAKKEGMRDA
jgi:hypothetical protein